MTKPDGYYHNRISIIFSFISLIPIGFCAAYQGENYWLRIFLAWFGCAIAGCVITPDLDQESWTTAKTNWNKIPVIGWVFQYIWGFYWHPYALVNPHRGRSHTIWGTFDRILYLLPIVLGIFYLFHFGQGYKAFLKFPYMEYIYFNLGLLISDLGHILRDKYNLQL